MYVPLTPVPPLPSVFVRYGRQFDHKNEVVSVLSRESIDLLKSNFKDEMSDDDWRCVMQLKTFLGIM